MAEKCDGRDFDIVGCQEPPDQKDGRCIFHSEDPSKDPTRILDRLEEMKRNQDFRCPGWVFPVEVNLGRQKLAVAVFTGATFCKGAWFERATFCKDAWFDDATFSGDAWFDHATFKGAWFNRGHFKRPPSFQQATFVRMVHFSETRFLELTTFDETHFGPFANFGRTDLHTVTFRGCEMGGVALAEAYGVAQADYDNCEWGKWSNHREIPQHEWNPAWPYELLGFHLVEGIVFEERRARQSKLKADYRIADRVYREVRRSLEDHKHFQEAHRFSYRELEMRRLAYTTDRKDWVDSLWGQARANLLSFEGFYCQLSSFGESWVKPLIWLSVVLLLVFPFSFAQVGIKLGSSAGYFDLVAFSLRTASFMSDPKDFAPNAAVQIGQVLLRLIAPFLAVLFTLAVRRRFRR